MRVHFHVRLILWGFTLLLAGTLPAEEAFLEFHCAGTSQLMADARLVTLHKTLSAASATNLENIALDRISLAIGELLPIEKPAGAAALLQPLVRDFLSAESVGLFSGAATKPGSFVFALRLEPEKSRMWQESFGKLFGSKGESFSAQDFKGLRWVVKRDSFWSLPAGGWLLFGYGAASLEKQSSYAAKVKERGRPIPELKQRWLKMEADTAHVGGWFSLMKPARANLNIALGDDVFEVSATVREQQQVDWHSAALHVPKSLAKGQIVSFVAGQDVEAFLNLGLEFSQLPENPLTNQFCLWAADQMPFVNYMAWPVANGTQAIRSIGTNWPSGLNPLLNRYDGTELVWQTGADRLIWNKMRIFAPALYATADGGKPYLFVSGFPMPPTSPTVPDGLVSEIEGRTNLVYYDWEMTGKRLSEWAILDKMIVNRAEGPTDEDAEASMHEITWLNRISPFLGRSVTEIKMVAPNELSVTRKAPIGLTAFELVKFVDWICNANAGPINSAVTPGMPFPMAAPHP